MQMKRVETVLFRERPRRSHFFQERKYGAFGGASSRAVRRVRVDFTGFVFLGSRLLPGRAELGFFGEELQAAAQLAFPG
jgi:hypothetical protein